MYQRHIICLVLYFFRESVEDDLARIETGGLEAFRDENYVDPVKARAIHQAAQNAGMFELDYVNNEERFDELENI